ncbi:MAG: hypothetical protein IT423_06865 [Pirellulaceae bacterium]|nr:hypothetical protein [Pirellulaceae bacterium]
MSPPAWLGVSSSAATAWNLRQVLAKRASILKRFLPLLSVLGMVCLAISGCTPRIIVRQHPTADDEGIRYYRPKPYLLISALAKDTNASADNVSITLDYLPDFSEEYSINVRSGLGFADVNVGLQDGWNLVSINQKLDSQTDETIKATGDLLKAVVSSPTSGSGQSQARPVIQVPARNVPLGYYEAVIGKNRHGKKQLFGFRYVGFMPYQACPIDVCGSCTAACDDGLLYGLTFDSGVMTFKPLCDMAAVLPPSEQVSSDAMPQVPMTRNFSRSWTVKGGKEEANVTIQDSGSVPITVPFTEVNSGKGVLSAGQQVP